MVSPLFLYGGEHMAQNEVYHIGIGISVNGDKETKAKLTNIEKQADKIKKTKISTTATVKDNASSVMDKIEKKAQKFRSAKLSATATVKDSVTSTLDKVKNATDKINNKEAKVKVKAEDQASSIIEKANGKLNSWLKAGAKKIISIGIAGAVAAGGFGLKESIQTFSDFESSMKNVQAITQATDSDYKKMYDDAKQLGATTAFSAKQSADAMSYLGMAGYKTDDIISAMPGLLNAAAASGEDLAKTSDIISDAITSFGMKASDTNRLSDVMAAASANANTNIGLLGESFKYVGATAGAMKYSIEDTSIALGLMANAGKQKCSVAKKLAA